MYDRVTVNILDYSFGYIFEYAYKLYPFSTHATTCPSNYIPNIGHGLEGITLLSCLPLGQNNTLGKKIYI